MFPSRNNTTEEYISSLIQTRQENEFVDFKQFYYHDDKKYDLIKDIVSFSNESTSVDKYIVFGVINGTWAVEGVNLSTIPDVSVINDLLHMYVEPFIYVEVGQIKYNGKDLALGISILLSLAACNKDTSAVSSLPENQIIVDAINDGIFDAHYTDSTAMNNYMKTEYFNQHSITYDESSIYFTEGLNNFALSRKEDSHMFTSRRIVVVS